MKFTRRDSLILAASAGLAASFGLGGSALAQDGVVKDQTALANIAIPDKPLGSETAPVTLIEYASPTCPHCATFHNDVYPALKADYIETGKVKFLLRPFVRNVLDAVVFMLAEAAGPEQFHNVIETYYKTQNEWASAQDPRAELLRIAMQLGFTDQTFDAALTNQELFAKMETMREQALNEFGLAGTPTFYLNGKTLGGGRTFDEFKAEIDPLVPAGFIPTAPAS